MNKINEILSAINLKVGDKEKVVILIDGRGGSGKSTFSHKLAKQLSNALVLNLDLYTEDKIDLYDKSNIEKGFGIDFKNIKYDEKDLERITKESSIKYIIIEGCFSFKNIRSIKADFKIWVEIESGIAKDRLNFRERNDKNRTNLSTEIIELATKMWQKSEDEYLEEFDPIGEADFVYFSK